MRLELCFAISFLEEENNYFLYLKYCTTSYTGSFYSPILPLLPFRTLSLEREHRGGYETTK